MFQFTLPRGERPVRRTGRPPRRSFNSRSRGGSDRSMLGKSAEGIGVSIHAPAGGATRGDWRKLHMGLFQFTLPRGERPVDSTFFWYDESFNSRSRGGSDASAGKMPPDKRSFNSRSRGGSDRRCPRGSCPSRVSIHAPAGGATRVGCVGASGRGFQFTLPRGERPVTTQ